MYVNFPEIVGSALLGVAVGAIVAVAFPEHSMNFGDIVLYGLAGPCLMSAIRFRGLLWANWTFAFAAAFLVAMTFVGTTFFVLISSFILMWLCVQAFRHHSEDLD